MLSQKEPFDSGAVIEFLKQLMWCIKGKIGIIWDGASIHRSEEIRAFLRQIGRGRIELVRLPAYAPELNPVEGVWSLLKGFYQLSKRARPLALAMRALSRGERLLQKELYLDNGARTRRQALGVGNPQGLKLADKSLATANHRRLTNQSCDLC